jgi:hypothetical protein
MTHANATHALAHQSFLWFATVIGRVLLKLVNQRYRYQAYVFIVVVVVVVGVVIILEKHARNRLIWLRRSALRRQRNV